MSVHPSAAIGPFSTRRRRGPSCWHTSTTVMCRRGREHCEGRRAQRGSTGGAGVTAHMSVLTRCRKSARARGGTHGGLRAFCVHSPSEAARGCACAIGSRVPAELCGAARRCRPPGTEVPGQQASTVDSIAGAPVGGAIIMNGGGNDIHYVLPLGRVPARKRSKRGAHTGGGPRSRRRRVAAAHNRHTTPYSAPPWRFSAYTTSTPDTCSASGVLRGKSLVRLTPPRRTCCSLCPAATSGAA